MLPLVQLKIQRGFAAGADQKQAHAMLWNAEIGAVDNVRGDHVAECCHCLRPGGVQRPSRELLNILDQYHFWSVELGRRHNRPCGGAGCIVLSISGLLPACLRVALAAWRSQHNVVRWDLRPIRLMQILANVNRVRMVGAVPFNRDRPVVGGP